MLDDDGLTDLVHDVRTPMGFFTGGDLDMPPRPARGLPRLVGRAAVADRRAAGPHRRRRSTSAPDGSRSTCTAFADDDDAEMAHFLAEAGFLHLAGLFTEAEMAAVSRRHGRRGRRPTTATTGARGGRRPPTATDRAGAHAALPGAVADDRGAPRRRPPARHRPAHRRRPPPARRIRAGNVVEALVKPIGVVEGISDVPWHKDCSLGSHSYRCCSLTVGISVTGADAASGQLRVVAGSHRALIQPAFVRRGLDLPRSRPAHRAPATSPCTSAARCT